VRPAIGLRIGIGFSGVPFTTGQVVEFAKRAERFGFHSAWFAEDYFLRDAITMMSAAAVGTKRVLLGTGVITPFTRDPVLIAETLATIDEMSNGRALLGIGTGVASLVNRMTGKVEKPLAAIEESCHIIRELLRGTELNFQGSVFQANAVKLGTNPYSDMQGTFKPKRREIPIYLAAKRPRMLQLAGRIGDGLLLGAGIPPAYVRSIVRDNIKLGAQAVNRNPNQLDLAEYVLMSLGGAQDEKIIKSFLAFELAYSNPEYVKAANVDESQANRIRETLESRGVDDAIKLVDNDALNTLSAFGKAEKIREKIQERVESGTKHPVICPTTTKAESVKKMIDVTSKFWKEISAPHS